MPPENAATADLTPAINTIVDRRWSLYSITAYDDFVEVHLREANAGEMSALPKTIEELEMEGWRIEEKERANKLLVYP